MTAEKPTQTVEIRPGIFIQIPLKDSGLKLIKRRLFQVGQVCFSPRFAPDRDVARDAKERYSQPTEIEYYKALALSGFYEPEEQSFLKAKEINSEMKTAIVIGCGTGREAFALEKAGLKVTAVDFSHKMIATANKIKEENHSSVIFTTERPSEKFDLVLVTYGLTNHLLSFEERVEVIKSFRPNLKPDGLMIFSGYFRKINFGDRFFIASQILRMRYLLRKKWEPGLTVISHFGFHNDEAMPLPFYFYQTKEEQIQELKQAGFEVFEVETIEEHTLETYPNFFVGKRNS